MRKKKKNSPNRTVEISPVKAADLLATGHYKEAIDAYKQLLKQEQRDDWQAALAKAYLLRAQALADKGMYKEAAVLWENRANFCQDNELIEHYIDWLIRAGRYVKAANLVTKSTEQLSSAAIWQIQTQLGALLLVGYTELESAFDKADLLIKHYALVKKALAAYSQGDDKTVEDFLKKIPFRSPYRDFRAILKSLVVIETEPSSVEQLLDKVPANSPYTPFAELIRMTVPHFEPLWEGLSQLTPNELTFLAHLKGWDKAQLKIISALQSAAKRNSPQALLETVASHRHFFGDNYSRQFCLALLPSNSAGIKFYEKTFGSLSVFERNRVTALNYERQGLLFKAEKHWHICVESLKKHPEETDNTLKAALILRHLVELSEKRGEVFDDKDVPCFLAESLRLAPNDKSSYLKLIQWYKHNGESKIYNKWVEAAAKNFPQESDILLIATEAATAKKAFKKAAGFAKTLLKVDPINVKARQIARTCHIFHARKLIKSGKYDLARKELQQAAQFEKTSQRSGVIEINQALLELQALGSVKPKTTSRKTKTSTKDVAQSKSKDVAKPKSLDVAPAVELLREGVQLAGGGMLGSFRAIVESQSQRLNPTDILSFVSPLKKSYLPSRQEVLELVNLINSYSEEGSNSLDQPVKQLKAPLKKAVKLDFSLDEMLSICQCFKKLFLTEPNELLTLFAEQALKNWPEHPALVFYQIYAEANGICWKVSMPKIDRLHEAAKKAEQQGDKRTTLMIMEFLNPIQGRLVPPPFRAPFDEDDLVDIESEIKALDGMDPDNMSPSEMMKLINLLNRLEEMGIEIPDFDIPIFPKLRRKRKR